MKTPELAAEIVSAIKEAVSVPVTVKMRLGWDEHSINYLEFADKLVAAGADALALHARTRKQGYSGTADRNAFYTLARHVNVPVIASGDMFSVHDVMDVLGNPNEGKPVQAVMLARGIMGKPFLFRELLQALDAADAGAPERAETSPIHKDEVIRTAEQHLTLMTELYGEARACVEFRKHMCAYLKGVQGGAALRNQAVHASSTAEYKKLFELWSC
jgi:tRNA-dihydrouridine synthase